MTTNSVATSTIYTLSIFGTRKPATLDATRQLHNSTAGTPQNIAGARSLGDLSHMVYTPFGHAENDAHDGSNLLFIDTWNNLDGLNQFFTIPQVIEQGGEIFSARDAAVWVPAEGFTSYHFQAPHGKNDRIVGIVRGVVNSREQAQAAHNELVGSLLNKARAAGNMSHDCFWRLTPPGTPESLEFFAIDVWFDAAGMGKHYEDPDMMRGLMGMFSVEPSATVWAHPAGEWVEW